MKIIIWMPTITNSPFLNMIELFLFLAGTYLDKEPE